MTPPEKWGPTHHVRTVSHFGPLPWRDRLRILLGGGVTARTWIACNPGRTSGADSAGDLYVRPPGKHPRGAFPLPGWVTAALKVVGWSQLDTDSNGVR